MSYELDISYEDNIIIVHLRFNHTMLMRPLHIGYKLAINIYYNSTAFAQLL